MQPLREVEQEVMKEGSASYGMRNTKAYEKEYGPYTGQIEGEVGWAEIQETN